MDMVNNKQTLIIAVLSFIVLALIAYILPNIVITLNRNISDNDVLTPTMTDQDGAIAKIRNASLILQSIDSNKIYKIGDTVSFNINSDYDDKYYIAVDAIVEYLPTQLRVIKIENSKSFDAYPLSIDRNSKIYVSAIMNPENKIKGVQTLATVSVEFLTSGKIDLNILYKPFQTTDSNIMPSGSSEDVLGRVENLSFQVN
jgi:hypothetical protein